MSFPLSEDFLNALVAEINDADSLGVYLGGSYARGDAGEYSDVDLAHMVPDDHPIPPKVYAYREGCLVSFGVKSCGSWRRQMADPFTAIYAVPSLRQCRILLDKTGALAALQREALDFTWESVEPRATALVNEILMDSVEYAHKVLTTLGRGDALALAKAQHWLLQYLTQVVAVHHGALITSANTYFADAQAAAGMESRWSRLLEAVALGGDIATSGPARSQRMRLQAATLLTWYSETIRIVRPVLTPETLGVAEQSLVVIARAGLLENFAEDRA
jgi:hypothetical protein